MHLKTNRVFVFLILNLIFLSAQEIENGVLGDKIPFEAGNGSSDKLSNDNDAIVSCYYAYGDPIDPTVCTHLMVFGATIYLNGTITFLNSTAYKEIAALKAKNPKLLISVTAGGDPSLALKDPVKTNRLADQILEFLTKSKFDGFDLDWEINSLKPIKPPYKGMANFFRILRAKFQKEPRRLYLTAAVIAVPLDLFRPSYEVALLNESLDFINLMTYDFYQFLPTQPYTGHNSPLFKRPEEVWILGWLNTAWAALHWYKKGMHHKKIAVGIPTYGHTYTLLFKFWHTLRAPAIGVGKFGTYIGYGQVCDLLKKEYYNKVWDDHAKVPYCYKDNQWISYDDLTSVSEKANWIKQQGFGGAMIYDFGHDDPNAACDNKTTFPLHRKIWSILKT